MPRDEDDAILSLEGFALEGLLTDLDPEAVSGLRGQLGLSEANIGYGREDLYNGKFADDDGDLPGSSTDHNRISRSSLFGSGSGRDWEDEVDKEFQEDKNRLVQGGRTSVDKVRGEIDDYDDDDDEEEEESLAADSPQMYRSGKDHIHRQGLTTRYSSSTVNSSSPAHTPLSPMVPKPPEPQQVDVEALFPSFVPHAVLEFTELFSSLPRKRQKISNGYANINYPQAPQMSVSTSKYLDGTLAMPTSKSTQPPPKVSQLLDFSYRELISNLPPTRPERDEPGDLGQSLTTDRELEQLTQPSSTRGTTAWKLPTNERGWEALTMQDWEENIVWEPSGSHASLAQPLDTTTRLTRPRNPSIDEGEWLRSVIWDAKNKSWKDFTTLELIPEHAERPTSDLPPPTNDQALKPHNTLAVSRFREQKSQPLDPFNLSNDRLYEVSKEQRRRVRQTFGNLEVQHSYPALKLQLPLYKTRLTKHEARSFHRPALQFPVDIPIRFSRVKIAKKKKDKAGRKIRNTAGASELLKSIADLTLKDTGAFMLFEYSEEAPPIISNVGMGSILVNYYRKKDGNDEHIPKDDLGEPFVLDIADTSPFMKFGSIQPGETVPTLYNNLVRAPLFKHKPSETDFLVIKSITNSGTNYYIRAIENVFVVGQTFPAVEVPGPHSRKVNYLTKVRLYNIAHRLSERSPGGEIQIQSLMKYFHDSNELQMRQRLKEFMEYHRKKGHHQGSWAIRASFKLPDELSKLATPEWVCLAESMQVGQRQLLDAGYGKDADAEGDGDDQSKLDIEQQLAPWSTTKNFLQATQNKAMLRLYGDGDPSGRGEAFSFIKVSMKEVFLRYGETMEDRQVEIAARPKSTHKHTVNEQQDIYQQEIERIWQSQRTALSNPSPPQLTQEDELRARGRLSHAHQHTGSVLGVEPPWSAGVGTPVDWSAARRSRSPSTFSRQSSPERDDGMSMGSRNNVVGANKALKIRRLIDGKWQTEVVRDPTIVNAYLRQRRLIDDQESSTEALMPSDDPEKNRMAKRRIEEALAKLKRNQERRLARKNAKEAGLYPPPKRTSTISVELAMPSSGPTTNAVRKCGNCGQVGHMKTNRKCPRWVEFNALVGGVSTPGSAGTPGADEG